MTQTQSQFQRPFLRIGSIAFLAGIILSIVSTAIHPSREDPSNHPLVYAEYASDDSWIAVHIGQFAGGIMVFAGGFVALPLACGIRIKHGFYTSMDWSCTCYNDSQCHCCPSSCRWNCTQDGSRFLG
jgi:hypothetical protein